MKQLVGYKLYGQSKTIFTICVELNSDNTVNLHKEVRVDRDGGDIVNEGQRMTCDSFKEPLT